MLGAVRRGSASCTKLWLRRPTIQSFTPRLSLLRQGFPEDSFSPSPTPISRHFQNACLLRQHAASQTAEAEAIEESVKQEVKAPSPPSELPVTKFAELQDRGLVCKTIVKTLTSQMGLETMTEVQSRTINETLKGIDV